MLTIDQYQACLEDQPEDPAWGPVGSLIAARVFEGEGPLPAWIMPYLRRACVAPKPLTKTGVLVLLQQVKEEL